MRCELARPAPACSGGDGRDAPGPRSGWRMRRWWSSCLSWTARCACATCCGRRPTRPARPWRSPASCACRRARGPGPRAARGRPSARAARRPVCNVSRGTHPTWARARTRSLGALGHSLRLSASRLCPRCDAADSSVCGPGACWPRPALRELWRGAAPAQCTSAAAPTGCDPATGRPSLPAR